MQPELKQKWIEALESGKYSQIQGKLKGNDGGYCCLGVLCELARKEINYDGTDLLDIPEEDSTYNFIERELIGRDISYSKFVEMNDDEGLSFQQIANYIKEAL